MEQLLCHFPNLKDVKITGIPYLVEAFNDELCKAVLENCPKLNSFEVHLFCSGTESYCDVIYNARLLQTAIDLRAARTAVSDYGGLQEFVMGFPRLRKIYGESGDIDTFEKLLGIVENTPNLQHIKLDNLVKDGERFAERYFATKTIDEQSDIKETLSKVADLHLSYNKDVCVHAMKFIAQYLTGLKSFSITNYNGSKECIGLQEKAFMYILDILGTLKNDCKLDMYGMKLDFLVGQLPNITRLIFQQMLKNTTRKRTLQITLANWDMITMDEFPQDSVELHIEASEGKIDVTASNQLTLHELVTTLFPTISTFDHIDSFILRFDYGLRDKYYKPININVYEKIFRVMPLLKEVVFDVPALVEENKIDHTKEYPRLQKMILQATANTNYGTLLTRCGTMFPNLKYLVLHYSCGKWNEELGEFRLNLDKLTVDLTPIKSKMKQDFFVLDVQLTKRKRHLYLVSLDFSFILHTDDDSLRSFFNDESYVRLCITIESLQLLELFIYPNDEKTVDYLRYSKGDIKRTIIKL